MGHSSMSMSMTMDMASATNTGMSAAPSETSMGGMGHDDMSSAMGGCKISVSKARRRSRDGSRTDQAT